MSLNLDLYAPVVTLRHWNVCVADVPRITKLLAAGFDGKKPETLTFGILQEMLDGPTRIFAIRKRVDTAFGEIVSMATLCQLRNVYGYHGYVHDVVTDEDHQGQGLGRVVMETLLKCADDVPMLSVSLTCSAKRTPARKLYESLGFRNVTDIELSDSDRGQLSPPPTALFKRENPERIRAAQPLSAVA